MSKNGKEKTVEEKNKAYSEEFIRQVQEFAEDRSYFNQYEPVNFDGEVYLIRLFKFNPSKNVELKSPILLESPITGEWKSATEAKESQIMAFGIIVKVGEAMMHREGGTYLPGDIVVFNSHDILGEDFNPQWLQLLQFQRAQGARVIVPEGMRQKIPSVEIRWGQYQFTRPWLVEPEEDDKLTYLVPEFMVKGGYNVELMGELIKDGI